MKKTSRMASWEISKNCNLSCKHCVAFSGVQNQGKELMHDQKIKLINILAKYGFSEINITGGEPLLVKDLNKILYEAKKYNISISLITNGTILEDVSLRLIKDNLDSIVISLDGINSQENDLIRGTGHYEKALDTIKKLQEHNINYGLSYTIFGSQSPDTIIQHAKGLGASFTKINQLIKRGRAIENWPKLGSGQIIKFNKSEYIASSGCDISNTSLFISPSGDIYSCAEIYQNTPQNKLGNLLDDNPEKIFLKLRADTNKGKCVNCPYTIYVSDYTTITTIKEGGLCELSKKHIQTTG